MLDEKSNPLAVDNNGNTVFINAAKNCQFWCLNYMYDYIRSVHYMDAIIGSYSHRKTYGPEEVYRLLNARDNDGWSAIEWSVESGDINTVEYLIKKGLNPSHVVEKSKQNCLHIAISHHRVDVACFLLDIGVDYTLTDFTGKTALQHHALTQDSELKSAIMTHPRVRACCRRSYNQPPGSDLESGIDVLPTYYSENGKKLSYAIKRTSPTRLSFLMIYACVTAGAWLLSMVVPFYAYIPLIGLGGGGYRYLSSSHCPLTPLF